MNTKRFFWLKLKNDFFDQKEIKMLRRLAGGDTFTVIYLKILLLSLKNDGRIYYDGIASNMVDEIALEIDEDIENTQVTFNYLQQKGMIMFNADDEIEISNIASLVGSESDSARRVRKHREQKALQCNTEVTPKKQVGNTEIEIDREKERERDKEREYIVAEDFIFPSYLFQESIASIKKGNPSNYEKRVPIAYLNQKMNKSFKFVDKNIKLVEARLNESYTLDDFKTVIDKKVAEWSDGDMSKYLRPETLFGTKFDGYLNQEVKTNKLEHTGSSDYDNIGW